MRISTRKSPAWLLLLAFGTALGATSPAVAAKSAKPANRGMESVKQPVVQRTDFVFDAMPDGYSGLSEPERARILDWFDAIDLRYGDRVGVVTDGLYRRSGVIEAIRDLAGRYGLLLAEDTPVTAGRPSSGGVRIVVSRAVAHVPGCPDWGQRSDGNFQGGLSSNYGCATNGNLAAMIANPEDLVHGRETRTDLRGATSNRAIRAYQAAPPTGAGGLK